MHTVFVWYDLVHCPCMKVSFDWYNFFQPVPACLAITGCGVHICIKSDWFFVRRCLNKMNDFTKAGQKLSTTKIYWTNPPTKIKQILPTKKKHLDFPQSFKNSLTPKKKQNCPHPPPSPVLIFKKKNTKTWNEMDESVKWIPFNPRCFTDFEKILPRLINFPPTEGSPLEFRDYLIEAIKINLPCRHTYELQSTHSFLYPNKNASQNLKGTGRICHSKLWQALVGDHNTTILRDFFFVS